MGPTHRLPRPGSSPAGVRTAGLQIALLLCATGCRPEAPKIRAAAPRPVTAINLSRIQPDESLHLTGSVEAWKEEDIGFEVAGRVAWVAEEQVEVTGPVVGAEGAVLEPGAVLARLESTRYELQVARAEAEVVSAAAQAEATQVEIEDVLAAQLASAQAELDRATRDFARIKELIAQEAGSETEYYRQEANLKICQAGVSQVNAMIAARTAELKAIQAQRQQAEQAAREAGKNLEDCALTAPFEGRISRAHVLPGAYVQPGQAVVRLVMMDPMKVVLMVSADTDRRINVGDHLAVYPPDWPSDQPLWGHVHFKDTVADPATRTFEINIVVRNRKIAINLPTDPQLRELPRFKFLIRPERRYLDRPSPLFVEAGCLHQDDDGYFVWRAEPADVPGGNADQPSVFRLHKLRVRPGDEYVDVVGLYLFRRIEDPGELRDDDFLAWGVPPEVEDNGLAMRLLDRWLFRPGELVEVALDTGQARPGLYVPLEAIRARGADHAVFVVEDGASGTIARRVAVQVGEKVGELARIDADGLVEGTQVILEGVHFLVDGEAVNVVETVEVRP